MKKLLTILTALVLTTMLSANNITISNLSLTGKNAGSQYTMVKFDISWENSWRTSSATNNWDAAWVFVKYRVSGGAWQQAWLNESGHTAPSGSTIDPGLLSPGAAFSTTTNPGLGAFIYRSTDGAASTFSKTGVQLRWNYGANGVPDDAVVDIRVFAIEMVYLPAGSFAAGSGGAESNAFTLTTINSPNATTTPSGTGSLGGAGGGYPTGQTAPENASWPNGYNPFYCMKYEISQQQYVDFLNTLTSTQASNRYSSGSIGQRYGLSVSGGVYSTTNPYVACNYLSWMDGAAYTDWAGLRPMTELEFEKACRGTATPVAGEFAWGNTTATSAKNITNGGAANETTNTSGANAVFYDQINVQEGPMRTGVFATGSTTRADAGDTYYGIMEMSGNLWERTVTVGNATGRAFTGVHGNAALSASGYADISTWPGYNTSEVTGSDGSVFRGGSWGDLERLCVSDRFSAAEVFDVRSSNHGFRAVRSMPFNCGISTLTINHLTSGGVAPVDKTVTYGTVSTTLFGGTKCAITRNLGASQQATAATDNTEASAGWCWQFNSKQGYMHDGTYRYPNSGWNGNSGGNSNWTADKDPCSIELGTGWRIPTDAEWISADGSWSNYNDTYASGLKLHAAGFLSYYDGSLVYRGSIGRYWSSSQRGVSGTTGYYLDFYDYGCAVGSNSMAYGFSLRCLRDMIPTVSTTEVSNIGSTTATSGGNVTNAGDYPVTARGVCWSTTSAPTITNSITTDGTGAGTFSSTITGLSSGTLYYVRAYATSSAGTAYGNQVTCTTAIPFICGTSSIIISHTAGDVAPVDKTVTYGAVSTTLFGGTKCAITRNLGATNQASSATDTTEASAGWYWQFNRKQGFKHGATRTPSTTWITIINEDSDWVVANDPCTIELGTGWRIPTTTEWAAADANGSWGNYNDTFNSVLKLHAAGLLLESNGSLGDRGSKGYYGSSTQLTATYLLFLGFSSGLSGMATYVKAGGYSVRCVRD